MTHHSNLKACVLFLFVFSWPAWRCCLYLLRNAVCESRVIAQSARWDMCSTLVSRHAQAPYEHRCAFMPLTLNLAWNVSQVSDLGLITALWCLMCGSCCQCGVMCMCPVWMKPDFDFGMCTLCVLIAGSTVLACRGEKKKNWDTQIPYEEEDKRNATIGEYGSCSQSVGV